MRFTSPEQAAVVEFRDAELLDEVWFFTGIKTGNYLVETSVDGEGWSEPVTFEQTNAGQFGWYKLDVSARIAKYVRVRAERPPIYLGEIVCFNVSGDRIPLNGSGYGAMLADDQETFPDHANYLTNAYFDEIYHVRTAYEHIINGIPASLDKETLQGYNINNYIHENLTYDKEKNESVKKELLKSISLTKGRIQSGEKIIDHGEIVKAQTYDILESLRSAVQENSDKTNKQLVMIGQIIIITIILCAFYLYLLLFRKKFLVNFKNVAFMLGMITILCVLTSIMVKNEYTPNIVPYALLPILVTCFFDTRTALFAHLTAVLLSSFIVPNDFEFLLMQSIVRMMPPLVGNSLALDFSCLVLSVVVSSSTPFCCSN
jgi:hypothetical protein